MEPTESTKPCFFDNANVDRCREPEMEQRLHLDFKTVGTTNTSFN